jgi:hypothetical protein
MKKILNKKLQLKTESNMDLTRAGECILSKSTVYVANSDIEEFVPESIRVNASCDHLLLCPVESHGYGYSFDLCFDNKEGAVRHYVNMEYNRLNKLLDDNCIRDMRLLTDEVV